MSMYETEAVVRCQVVNIPNITLWWSLFCNSNFSCSRVDVVRHVDVSFPVIKVPYFYLTTQQWDCFNASVCSQSVVLNETQLLTLPAADIRTQLRHLPGQVCMCVCARLCARLFLHASEIILVKEAFPFSVSMHGGVRTWNRWETTNPLNITVCESVFVKEVLFFLFVRLCAWIVVRLVYVLCLCRPPAPTAMCSSTGAISVSRLSSQNAFQLSAFQNNRHWCPRLFLQGPSAALRFNMPPLICWSAEGGLWYVVGMR